VHFTVAFSECGGDPAELLGSGARPGPTATAEREVAYRKGFNVGWVHPVAW
jgi:hypothetical protein